MDSKHIPQRKHTAATVITIIELIAALGLVLTVGLKVVLPLAQDWGWLLRELRASAPADVPDAADTPAPVLAVVPEEEQIVVPDVTPSPVHCPDCSVLLTDLRAQYFPVCGYDQWRADEPTPEHTPTPLPPAEMSLITREEAYRLTLENALVTLPVWNTSETSIVTQKGTHDNSAHAAVDGNTDTSWQEGVAGDGLGESITLDMGQIVQIQCIEAYLGNWRSDDWYVKNNVPKKLRIEIYGSGEEEIVEQVLTFPKERKTFYIGLNRPVYARYIEIEIVDVYPGSKYDDTCIAEIRVCGYEE